MKRSAILVVVMILLCVAFGVSQNSSGSDQYKPMLDRLESLTRQGESEWRFHADIPHPEDPGLSDSDWGVLRVKNVSGPGGRNANEEHWNGTRVFRRWIQVPEKINGYAVENSQVKLDLRFRSRPSSIIATPRIVTVFCNGVAAYHGNEDDIQPILLSARAQPGQKLLVAAR